MIVLEYEINEKNYFLLTRLENANIIRRIHVSS